MASSSKPAAPVAKKPAFAPAPAEKKPASAAAPSLTPDQLNAQIGHRAEEIFNERSKAGKAGDALGDWLKAEKEVKSKLGIKG